MVRILYNILFPLLTLPATPFWLLKTKKRGGLSNRLWEKLSIYDAESPAPTADSPQPIYLHAASVGEANIARKLITQWHHTHPERRFLLAVGTSTGFDLAKGSPPPATEVLYAPLDFPTTTRSFLARYRPALIVLIEHEVWPNLMHHAHKQGIPIALANARLSPRSGKRLAKASKLLGFMYQKLAWVGAQTDADIPRLAAIGIEEKAIHAVGSIKFDPALSTPSASKLDPRAMLETMSEGKTKSPILMALSTHSGEELIFARAASRIPQARIIIIPRHMERRAEIVQELDAAGYPCVLRSTLDPQAPQIPKGSILIVDSTGEMPAFTALADLTFIGKTLTAEGGQNPCEAIAAKVAVITGPHLENFEPLATELRAAKGLTTIRNEEELAEALTELLANQERTTQQIESALTVLGSHHQATDRTITALNPMVTP